jgi:hypothetical protein
MVKKQPDQRAYPRFKVRTGVSTALGETKIGTIADIGRDGLVISCFDLNDQDQQGLRGSSKLSIFHDDGFSLKNIPCKILGECSQIQNVSGSSIKQCHIQFNELTPEQKSQLENFLDHFTDKPFTSQ